MWIARQRFSSEYGGVIDRIERRLAEQPLPRLQTVGTSETVFPFIYDLGPDWGANQHFSVHRLRSHGPRGPVIPMLPGAGDEQVRLAPLVRPLVELHWTRMVGRLNGVATVEEDLRRHLFGSPRIVPTKMLRHGLRDLQANQCFYCHRPLLGLAEVDHFIPRVRSANDSVENLVLTDRGCNGDKSDLLAAPGFVASWTHRNREQAAGLALIAEMAAVESDHEGTVAVARSIYAHLPPAGTPMWHGRKQIIFADPGLALAAMG